ncbi:unnamed protein product [Thlaspi arvense]|uniref:Uncharacterized protein n=1 Tax=Thlaspi arvense TaxID=13288 RepID=A0AAU9SUJ6_THLAR|nr:unnamed protein product [Thlaspi arvense]
MFREISSLFANWFWKLKQWKIDAHRRQCIYHWKRANVGGEENSSRLRSLRHKLTDRRTASDRFSHLQASRIDHERGSFEFTRCDDDNDDNDKDVERESSTPLHLPS